MAGTNDTSRTNRKTKRQGRGLFNFNGLSLGKSGAPKHKKTPERRANPKDHRNRQMKKQPVPPPVMARGYNMDVTFQTSQPRVKKVRRRLDVPLPIPGAEVRLPSIPAMHFGWRWISLIILVGLIGLLYFLWSSPFFRINNVQVDGLNHVRADDINAVLGLTGKSIFTLRAPILREKLQQAFPEFSAVSVSVSLPNDILVEVKERVPVLTWQQGQNIQLIDQDGYAFPFRLAATSVITPVVEATGSPASFGISAQDIAQLVAGNQSDSSTNEGIKNSSAQPFLTPEMVSAVIAISKTLPADVPLIYDPEHGFGWQDTGGWQVYLGDDKDIEMKLRVYEALVGNLASQEVQPSLISVEHVHNPYYRVEG